MKNIFLKQLRESINIFRYDKRRSVERFLRFFRILVSGTAFGSIVYYYGYPQTPETTLICFRIIEFSFLFYVVKYAVELSFSLHPIRHIRRNWFEGVVILVVALLGLAYFFINESFVQEILGSRSMETLLPFILVFVQLYFLIIVSIEIGRASPLLAKLNLGPSAMLSWSFIFLILSGAGLLMLPEMTTSHSIPFIDALFTSASASCVTGLIVVDTATYFTFKGQFIIMLLIQLGGINIISFATFFTTFYLRSEGGVKFQSLLKDFLSADKVSDSRSILREVILLSLTIELIGSAFIFFAWDDNLFPDIQQKIFFTIFHAISAFNNAGFSLFSNNLYELAIRDAMGLQVIIALLIITGGFGFANFKDLRENISFRIRPGRTFRKLRINTRLSAVVSLILILVGTVVFYLVEHENTMLGRTEVQKWVGSFFQSVTTRTAGFNTVDFGQLAPSILFFMMFLMYIGASPGSTGGGIKTTTFAVLVKSAIDTLRGKKYVEFYRRTISFDNMNKAYSLVLFSLSVICLSTFLLMFTEPQTEFLKILFEEVSAFATVGLSTGITAGLSFYGKVIIIVSMLVGRIGPLTLALALSKKVEYSAYRYGRTQVLIG